MTSEKGLDDAEIIGLDSRDMERLYGKVMDEMITRQQKKHSLLTDSPVDPGSTDAATAWPEIETLDDEELLRHYRAVRGEMMRRHHENPGIWEPAEDS